MIVADEVIGIDEEEKILPTLIQPIPHFTNGQPGFSCLDVFPCLRQQGGVADKAGNSCMNLLSPCLNSANIYFYVPSMYLGGKSVRECLFSTALE